MNSKIKESFIKFLAPYYKINRYLSFLNGYRTASAIFLICCVYAAISFVYPYFAFKTNSFVIPQTAVIPTAQEPSHKILPFETYLNDIGKKQLFIASSIEKPLLSQDSQNALENMDLIKDITLVGIVSGDNPQAIIQNMKSGKTYYLNKGQTLGDFSIDDIQGEKVILKYNGQTTELHL